MPPGPSKVTSCWSSRSAMQARHLGVSPDKACHMAWQVRLADVDRSRKGGGTVAPGVGVAAGGGEGGGSLRRCVSTRSSELRLMVTSPSRAGGTVGSAWPGSSTSVVVSADRSTRCCRAGTPQALRGHPRWLRQRRGLVAKRSSGERCSTRWSRGATLGGQSALRSRSGITLLIHGDLELGGAFEQAPARVTFPEHDPRQRGRCGRRAAASAPAQG